MIGLEEASFRFLADLVAGGELGATTSAGLPLAAFSRALHVYGIDPRPALPLSMLREYHPCDVFASLPDAQASSHATCLHMVRRILSARGLHRSPAWLDISAIEACSSRGSCRETRTKQRGRWRCYSRLYIRSLSCVEHRIQEEFFQRPTSHVVGTIV